jgi:hypothetical protein
MSTATTHIHMINREIAHHIECPVKFDLVRLIWLVELSAFPFKRIDRHSSNGCGTHNERLIISVPLAMRTWH